MSKKTKVQKFDDTKSASKLQQKWHERAAFIAHYHALELTEQIIEHGNRSKAKPVEETTNGEVTPTA